MNKVVIKEITKNFLEENDIFANVDVYKIDSNEYLIYLNMDYEEFLKIMILSDTEITDAIKIKIDFNIRDD